MFWRHILVRATSLVVNDLSAQYGKKLIIGSISFRTRRGDVVAIIGHNGAGKSTLLKAIFGVIPRRSGTIQVNGNGGTWTPKRLAGQGMGFVPQGHRVFGDLTVRENLEMGSANLKDRSRLGEHLEALFDRFPELRTKLNQRAASLSGGEKQMLALVMALISQPEILLLDEPSLGLAPITSKRMFDFIKSLAQATSRTILVVEQKVREVLNISSRAIVLRQGQITFDDQSDKLKNDDSLRQVYF